MVVALNPELQSGDMLTSDAGGTFETP
jgi:hypothetical protein